MSKHPWMPFYVQDFQVDTLDLAPDEVGVYFTMICLAWRRGDGSVPGDMAQLKTMLQRCMAGLHGLTFNRIVPKLLERYFQERNGFYYQKRVEKELRTVREISENGRRNAEKRWSKHRKNNNLTDATPMLTQPHSQSHKERKQDAAANAAPSGLETEFFRRCRQIFGEKEGGSIGGMVLKRKGKNIALSRALVETASQKENPREYTMAALNKPPDEEKMRNIYAF